jgi:hypothetical protein
MKSVRFEVLTLASMKMAVFRVVAPYSLVEVYRRFRGAYCLHYQDNAPMTTQKTAIFSNEITLNCYCLPKEELSFLHIVQFKISLFRCIS